MPGAQVFGFEHGGSRRYAELVNRLFGIESADAPMPPGFILEDDRPEWHILARSVLFTTGDFSVAANVGNLGRCQLINPANSQRLVVVKGAGFVNKTTQGVVRLSVDAPLIVAGQAANTPLDTRAGRSVSGLGTVSRNAIDNTLPASAGIVIDSFNVPALETRYSQLVGSFELGVILSPGHTLDMFNLTANEVARAIFWGYERPATPDELAQ